MAKVIKEESVVTEKQEAASNNSGAVKVALFASVAALIVAVFGLGLLIGHISSHDEPKKNHIGWSYNQPMYPYYDYGYGYSDPGYGWDTPVTEPMPIEGEDGIGNSNPDVEPMFPDDSVIEE